MEILHPRQRRHRAGAVRHHPGLPRGARRWSARAWTRWPGPSLVRHAARFDPALLNLAFVFLLLGYGTKVGLAPLHAWLPDAHAEGPTPISAVLSGLLLNVALYAVLRFKMLHVGQSGRARARAADGRRSASSRWCSPPSCSTGAGHQAPVRLLVDRAHGHHHLRLRHGRPARQLRRACCTWRMHSLTKSAIFFCVGHVAQVKGTQTHGRHPRPDRHRTRCSAGASAWASWRSPACRRSACS